jgi:hypothetical protein
MSGAGRLGILKDCECEVSGSGEWGVGRREILGVAEKVVDYDEMGYREEQTKALVRAIT